MSESAHLKATFRRLVAQQKTEEDAASLWPCFCGYAEKMCERYFTVTRKCKLDGCSCANYSFADRVATCPTKRKDVTNISTGEQGL